MMEESHAGEGHDDTVLVALFDDQIIADGAAGLGDVLDTGSDTALDGVGEGEESVGTQSNVGQLSQPGLLLLAGQRLGLLGEVVHPYVVADNDFFAVFPYANGEWCRRFF